MFGELWRECRELLSAVRDEGDEADLGDVLAHARDLLTADEPFVPGCTRALPL